MPSKVYWIKNLDNSARLGIMARPRGNDWLEDEIQALKSKKVDVLVSLLERSEILELNLEDEKMYCEVYGIQYINFPIPDRGVPQDDIATLLKLLVQLVESGKSLVIHCRMGIGRSSIIAAAVLLKFGFGATELMNDIGVVRGVNVPDTEEQINWLKLIQY